MEDRFGHDLWRVNILPECNSCPEFGPHLDSSDFISAGNDCGIAGIIDGFRVGDDQLRRRAGSGDAPPCRVRGRAAVPGPGTVYIAAQTVIREPGAALWGALGLHVGGYVIVFGSAVGLTVLFSAVPVIYEALKLFGAAYLVWLGIRLIVHRSRADVGGRRQLPRKRRPATFSQGVLVEILNPTTVVFYVAFLPQFIAPAGDLPVWLQFLVLGVLVNLIFSLGDVVAILIAMKVKATASNSEVWRRLSGWIGGSVLIALGIRLAADRS